MNKSNSSSVWEVGAIYATAPRYIEKMQTADVANWEYALWSSLALELLARAALSNVSPILLADEKSVSNLFYAIGVDPKEAKFTPKSIGTNEVIRRLRDTIDNFTKELQDFCVAHIEKRNGELHSGELPFDGVEATSWQPKFYRSCEVFLASMGYELKDFIGEQQAALAKTLVEADADQTARAVLGDIEAHKRVWLAKVDEEREILSTSSAVWATKQSGHRVQCPACSCQALLVGEPISAPQKTLDADDGITERQDYLPSRFECIACGLKISGFSRLSVSGLGVIYRKTQLYDAVDYYSTQDNYSGYEDDNNEPF